MTSVIKQTLGGHNLRLYVTGVAPSGLGFVQIPNRRVTVTVIETIPPSRESFTGSNSGLFGESTTKLLLGNFGYKAV